MSNQTENQASLARRHSRRQLEEFQISQRPPTPEELAFMAREFIMCTLPHSDPGDVPVWTRKNGFFSLTIQPGYDKEGRRYYGVPYGPLPRLLLAWLTSEALRTGSRHIELGRNFTEFLEKLGLSSYTGRGRFGDATRLRDQLLRLFFCLISFEYQDTRSKVFIRMLPLEKAVHFWGEDSDRSQETVSINLSKPFYDAITGAAVPLDIRILRHFKHSPMALDLYGILVRESYRAARRGEDRFIAWDWLHEQMGSDYSNVDNFRRYALPHVKAIIDVCPRMLLSIQRGGRGRPAGLVVSRFSDPIPRSMLSAP